MNKEVLSDNAALVSRRYFARNVVATAAVSLIPSVATSAEKITPSSSSPLGPIPEGLSEADWDEVYAKYKNLLRVYGERLSSGEKHTLVNILTTNQHMLASIRSFAVQNGDPSACTIRVYDPKQHADTAERI
jgi:hypothetical protein